MISMTDPAILLRYLSVSYGKVKLWPIDRTEFPDEEGRTIKRQIPKRNSKFRFSQCHLPMIRLRAPRPF